MTSKSYFLASQSTIDEILEHFLEVLTFNVLLIFHHIHCFLFPQSTFPFVYPIFILNALWQWCLVSISSIFSFLLILFACFAFFEQIPPVFNLLAKQKLNTSCWNITTDRAIFKSAAILFLKTMQWTTISPKSDPHLQDKILFKLLGTKGLSRKESKIYEDRDYICFIYCYVPRV